MGNAYPFSNSALTGVRSIRFVQIVDFWINVALPGVLETLNPFCSESNPALNHAAFISCVRPGFGEVLRRSYAREDRVKEKYWCATALTWKFLYRYEGNIQQPSSLDI